MITYFALLNLASWNSYDHKWPVGPIVLATEWEKDADPVPMKNKQVRIKMKRFSPEHT